jgi:hypothetical protein
LFIWGWWSRGAAEGVMVCVFETECNAYTSTKIRGLCRWDTAFCRHEGWQNSTDKANDFLCVTVCSSEFYCSWLPTVLCSVDIVPQLSVSSVETNV